jgi:Imm-5 like putative immunity protein
VTDPAISAIGRFSTDIRLADKSRTGVELILPKVRDPRFVTIRRGGTLTESDHQLLALWAADCAEHVLKHFERARPDDECPRHAIELGRPGRAAKSR